MKKIFNNLSQLTEEEKNLVDTATVYEYVYGSGNIYLYQGSVDKNAVSALWDCTDTTEAKDYLDSRHIPELP